MDSGTIVICCGGGGIPVVVDKEEGGYIGVEAVIDKDFCACELAKELNADGLIILTEGGGIIPNYGKPEAKEMFTASPKDIRNYDFPAGSMKPKVLALCDFVEQTSGWAKVGDLQDFAEILDDKKGTKISKEFDKITWYEELTRK